MLSDKATALIVAGIACLSGVASGLDAPCYGYGQILGLPSNYLNDDMEKIQELQVGKSTTYVSYIDFMFEGKNFLKLGYQKTDDPEFRDVSYGHGAQTNIAPSRYNLRDQFSRILNPGYVRSNKREDVIAFLFIEYFQKSLTKTQTASDLALWTDPWVLTAFKSQNVPWYDYVDSVESGLRQGEEYTWQVETLVGECDMLGNVPGTQIVGFASTQKLEVDDQLQSIQPIYFSTDESTCVCLGQNPSMTKDTRQVESIPIDEGFLDKLHRENELDTFVQAMVSLIIFIIAIAIVSSILCYFSKAKLPRKKQGFEDYTYIKLALKTTEKLDQMKARITYVKENGFTPVPKIVIAKPEEVVEAVDADKDVEETPNASDMSDRAKPQTADDSTSPMNLNGAVEMDSTRKSKDTSKLIAEKKRQAATLDLDELEDLAAE